jgi:hypothetical protein
MVVVQDEHGKCHWQRAHQHDTWKIHACKTSLTIRMYVGVETHSIVHMDIPLAIISMGAVLILIFNCAKYNNTKWVFICIKYWIPCYLLLSEKKNLPCFSDKTVMLVPACITEQYSFAFTQSFCIIHNDRVKIQLLRLYCSNVYIIVSYHVIIQCVMYGYDCIQQIS